MQSAALRPCLCARVCERERAVCSHSLWQRHLHPEAEEKMIFHCLQLIRQAATATHRFLSWAGFARGWSGGGGGGGSGASSILAMRLIERRRGEGKQTRGKNK